MMEFINYQVLLMSGKILREFKLHFGRVNNVRTTINGFSSNQKPDWPASIPFSGTHINTGKNQFIHFKACNDNPSPSKTSPSPSNTPKWLPKSTPISAPTPCPTSGRKICGFYNEPRKMRTIKIKPNTSSKPVLSIYYNERYDPGNPG
jgi:hypothetical protein